MPAIDHVILVVDDLDSAAERIERHGLASVPGGRHPGHGTGNRIIPLGDDYLELMAVVDRVEAAGSPLGRWVMSLAGPEPRPAALCVRTDDIDAVAARLGLEATPMSRERPDGVTLSWRLCGLAQALDGSGLPFFIEWDTPPAHHPGRTEVQHTVQPTGIRWVEVGGDPRAVAERLGDSDLPVRMVGGRSGVHRVGVETGAGEIVL